MLDKYKDFAGLHIPDHVFENIYVTSSDPYGYTHRDYERQKRSTTLAALSRTNVPERQRPDWPVVIDEAQIVFEKNPGMAPIIFSQLRAMRIGTTVVHQNEEQLASIRSVLMGNAQSRLILGADFPYRQFFPEGARIAQIDMRPEALGNRCPLELGLLGDVKETLAALLPRVNVKEKAGHLEDALANYARARKDLDSLADVGPDSRQPPGVDPS